MELKRSPKSWTEVELPELRKTINGQAAELDRLRETAHTLSDRLQQKEQYIINRDEQIFKLETELDRLRALLRRWNTMGLEISFELQEFPELQQLLRATTEALK